MSDTYELEQQEIARIPDGTRPLVVAGSRPSRSLIPSYVEPVNGRERTCYSVLHAEAVPETGVPASCRRRIVRGDHFLLYVELDLDARETGRTFAFCAPCAVRSWDDRVSEATP